MGLSSFCPIRARFTYRICQCTKQFPLLAILLVLQNVFNFCLDQKLTHYCCQLGLNPCMMLSASLSPSAAPSLFLPCLSGARGRVCLQSLACKYHCLPCGSLIKYACNAMAFLSAYCHTAATLISVIGLPPSSVPPGGKRQTLQLVPRDKYEDGDGDGQPATNYFKCQLINCKTFFCESTTNSAATTTTTALNVTNTRLHLHRATGRDNEVAAVDMKRDEHKNSGQGQDQSQGQDPAT